MAHDIAVLICLVLGGIGLAGAIYLPLHRGATGDHCMGIGMAGGSWLVACILTAKFLL